MTAAWSLQSCPTLWTMDCSLPGSSILGILQAGILEWVAMPSSRGSSQPRDQTKVSCIAVRFFTTEPPGKPIYVCVYTYICMYIHVCVYVCVCVCVYTHTHIYRESKISVQMFSHFSIRLCIFLPLSFKSPLYLLDTTSLVDRCLQKLSVYAFLVFPFSSQSLS